MTPPQNPSSEPTLLRPASEAILFIPGTAGPPLKETAFRIASAFNVCSHSAEAYFPVSSSQDEQDESKGNQPKAKVRTIQRAVPGQNQQNLIDVYEYNYTDALLKEHIKSNLLTKARNLFVLLLVNIPTVYNAVKQRPPQKSPRETAQFIYASAVLSLLIIYLGLLFIAACDVTGKVISNHGNQPQPAGVSLPIQNRNEHQAAVADGNQQQLWQPLLNYSPYMVVIVAIIEVFFPGLKKELGDVSARYAVFMGYLSFGTRRRVLEGNLNDLLDHMKAKGYERIHVVAYSFGSVLALDSIFPADRAPVERIKDIDTLVTVGCPFDLIRVLWPYYYERRNEVLNDSRKGNGSLTENWINIYSPIDVLGSNFRNDQRIEQPDSYNAVKIKETGSKLCPSVSLPFTQGSSTAKLSTIQFLLLAGLEAHNSYWEHGYESENTAFSLIIPEIYQDHPFLR